MTICDPTITNTINPNLKFIAHKQSIASGTTFEYEDNTSSKTLSYESGTRETESKLESNTSEINYNENRASLEPTIRAVSTWAENIEPTMRVATTWAENIEPITRVATTWAENIEPITRVATTWAENIEPITRAVTIWAERMESIIKRLEPILFHRKDDDYIKYEYIQEPIDFHIKNNNKEDLVIESIEDTKALLDDLKNVKVNKKLSKYFSKRLNE